MKNQSRFGRQVRLGLALTALVALSVSASDTGRDMANSQDPVRQGFRIVPPGVKLNLEGKDRRLVGLGSYIVNTSGCIDCHSHPTYSPGGDPFKGEHERVNAEEYLSGGRQFGPTITAPNITPDHADRPAGLTRWEFVQTLRTGHNPKDPPGTILQVMPWPSFGKKTDLDLIAVYEYLRAVPSLPDNTHPGP
jgi:hypothetical protein